MIQSLKFDWEPTPSYAEFVRGVVAVYNQAYANQIPMSESYWTFIRKNSVGVFGMSLVLAIAVALTLFRMILTRKVLQPVAQSFQLSPSLQVKVCESSWRFIIYTFTFSWAVYSAVIKRPLFQRPSTMFKGTMTGDAIPLDIDLLYAFEIGYYFHALYTLFFMDTWKRDSSLMAAHHVIALSLLSLSYIMNCATSGLLILLVHDCCDVPLELSKLLKYLARQRGITVPYMEQVAKLFFILFTITWFIFRLYFYPLRMIHTVSYTITSTKLRQLPFLQFSYLMALFLLVMNVYWSLLILRLIWNVSTGRMAELDDLRESDVVTDVRTGTTTKTKVKKTV